MGHHEALATAKARYPPRGGEADWNLTLSNRKRRRLNSVLQRRAAENEPVKVCVDGKTPFWCFTGTRLIGCNCTLRGIVNGVFLMVTRVSPEGIWRRDEDTGEEFEVSAAQVAKRTRLRGALTLISVQGRSLPGSVGIHDVDSRHFSVRGSLYVALSRATDGANVSIS